MKSVFDTGFYVNSIESTYKVINMFFDARLPKKIDYFVWSDRSALNKFFGAPFANSEFCTVHTSTTNTLGHEMTHILSHYAGKANKRIKTQLINEGTAVYFSHNGTDGLEYVKTIVSENRLKISIADIWMKQEKLGAKVIYPLGGLLVRRLIEDFGRDKFLLLVTNQTYKNALNIYGPELDPWLKKLDNDINVALVK